MFPPTLRSLPHRSGAGQSYGDSLLSTVGPGSSRYRTNWILELPGAGTDALLAADLVCPGLCKATISTITYYSNPSDKVD